MASRSKESSPSLSLLARFQIKIRQVLFPGSGDFWETRYALGGDSGKGSVGKLAEFKAQVINQFVEDRGIQSVIEFGCGDGNQLALARYPKYIGLDVSKTALAKCRERFRKDPTKSFFLYDPERFESEREMMKAELGLSLDVIYHLVEDRVYEAYLRDLFGSAQRYVMVYSSDTPRSGGPHARHVRHRHFTPFVAERFPQWELIEKMNNPYPGRGMFQEGSHADFFIYKYQEPR